MDVKERKKEELVKRLLSFCEGMRVKDIEKRMGISFKEFRKLPYSEAEKIVAKVENSSCR